MDGFADFSGDNATNNLNFGEGDDAFEATGGDPFKEAGV